MRSPADRWQAGQCWSQVAPEGRERVVAAAFADALARFNRSKRLERLPFYVANEEALSQGAARPRVGIAAQARTTPEHHRTTGRKDWTMTYRTATALR
ncbi:MAG: hypothetical protein M3454_08090 [Actinomycetota bacterium]|nr:hypothetical protein [Actinomycetota bacterium]